MSDHPIEARYRIAIEAGQIGIWTWDRTWDRIVWDALSQAMLDIAPEAPIALADLPALFHADDRIAVESALSAAAAAGSCGRIDLECRLAKPKLDGDHWVALYGQVEADDQGPTRICGAVRDISERYRVRRHNGSIQAHLSAIISIAADAIISLDSEQRITLFNEGAEKMFGYRRDEVIGGQLDMLLPERFRAAHSGHVARFGGAGAVSRRMGERQEIYARHRTGREFPAEASISHIAIDGQRVFTVVLRDVSERKRALEQLANSRAELESRVAERTAELKAEMQRREETQAQLLRTQRMEAFGQLTGGIAHDFNNLLTVITGNLELLEMRLEDERQRTLLKRAQDAAEMGARLTSRLLTFARRRQFEPALLDLNEQVMGMVDLLKRTIGEHIDLNARLAPRLGTVRADPSEIENAVLNLAINARDAMASGGRLVIETANIDTEADAIGVVRKLPAGAYVRLSVSDTGHGMAPDVVRRAFEPFFTTKQPGRGTGLGLSTILGFAEQSGGTATIYSEIDIGTTVSIYLPRVEGAAAPAHATGEASLPPGAGEIVLLVEDHAEVRDVTRQRLIDLGYRVLEAENGHAALALLEATPVIDLVFSDVVMPGGLSGLDLAQEVRRRWPGIRIVLASGFADGMLRGRQDAGALDIAMLSKPYSRADLAHALRVALES